MVPVLEARPSHPLHLRYLYTVPHSHSVGDQDRLRLTPVFPYCTSQYGSHWLKIPGCQVYIVPLNELQPIKAIGTSARDGQIIPTSKAMTLQKENTRYLIADQPAVAPASSITHSSTPRFPGLSAPDPNGRLHGGRTIRYSNHFDLLYSIAESSIL